jgi:hypothetical protein
VVTLADTIATGAYIAKEPLPVDDTKITAKELYQRSLRKFNSLLWLVNDGIISDTDVDFIGVKKYLIENYNINYID